MRRRCACSPACTREIVTLVKRRIHPECQARKRNRARADQIMAAYIEAAFQRTRRQVA
jgi:hypothetical protein